MNLEEMFLQMAAGDLVVPNDEEFKAETQAPARVGRAGQAAAPQSIGQVIDSVGQTLGGLSDIPAAATKGAVQGFAGLPGDIEGIGRLLLGAMGVNVEESTALPTTEEIKKFLDERLGKVGTGDNPFETVGEFMAPGGYTKAVKASAQGAKKVAGAVKETMATPPRGSVQLAPDLEVEIAPAERTKNFKNWFGDSKVVDEKGNPLIVYHGTGADFDEFKKKFAKQGRIGRGFYFATDPTQASNYAFNSRQKGGSPTVVPVYLKASNILNTPSYDKSKPIDGIKYGGMYLVYEPTQIKSATGNIGTFDPKDPRITRGAIGAPVAPAAMQDEENK